MKLVINGKLLQQIVSQCVNSLIEKVFIGVGVVSENIYKVDYIQECRNISLTPLTKFMVDPNCLINLYRLAEKEKKEITVIIHSHPAPPTPSYEDLKNMRLWRIPWIIIDSRGGEYRAWIVVDKDVKEVEIYFENNTI